MARDMTPVLKRCRSLDLDPVYLGIDKKSKRNARTGRKLSEYGMQLKENRKRSLYTVYWRSLSVITLRRLRN